MQADDVGPGQQLVQRANRRSVAERKLVDDVEITNAHADRLGENRQLRADVPVADDTEDPAADLMRAARRLPPDACVRQRRFLGNPPHQHDDLAQHQFRHRAGVGVGSVEDGDSLAFRRIHVYVVGADTEAADAEQAPRRRQDFSGQLGLRTDAEDMRFREQAAERVVVGSTRKRLDVDIAGVAQRLHGTGMDALGEHDADAITGD